MTLEELTEAAKTVFFGGEPQQVADLGLAALAVALAASLACSLVWAWAYSTFYGARATGSNVHRSFPLIGIAITAIFICVQFSLPLSLGLLGSLSIVRFRTPIKEPEEIGFILLVIASSLCCASFNGAFLIAVLVAAFAALALLRWNPEFLVRRAGSGTLVIRCATDDYREKLPALGVAIEQHLRRPALDSLTTQGGESVLTWSFRAASPESCAALEETLRRDLPGASVGIYYTGQANG